jgi:hypothetical protein
VGPPASLFSTFITTNTVASSSATATFPTYVGGQNGYEILPGASITLWLEFFLPKYTVNLGPETIQVQASPVYP